MCTTILVFSFSKPNVNDSVSIAGYVKLYGNEPFTFLGFTSDSGEKYSLIADENILQEVRKAQGKKIVIKGYKKTVEDNEKTFNLNTLKDGTFTVIEWEFKE